MQVPDWVRRSVVFLYAAREADARPVGSAFLVEIELRRTDRGSVCHEYLVSAKHVVEGAARAGQELYARLNFKDGGNQFVSLGAADEWVFHYEDTRADVAVLDWERPADSELLAIPITQFATAEVVQKYGIGVGEEVFVIGLFRHHLQTARNIPLLRAGHIAAMPEEPVNTKVGKQDAYLVELLSVGGFSGAPVFAYVAGERRRPDGGTYTLGIHMYLLGVLHGHWDLKNDVEVAADDALVNDERVNLGMAIVVPVVKLVDILESPGLKQRRENWLAAN